jgi:CheY-like chemotaxis protein
MRSLAILLAEDDETINHLLTEFLALRGYTVESAFNGAEAIEALRRRPYDAVVLDLMMPGIDGTAVIAFMLQTSPELVPKTVVISAYPFVASANQRERVGAVLQKPFDMDAFGSVVDACVAT